MSRQFSLSTIWRQGRFADLRAFFTEATEAGFSYFTLDATISLRELANLTLPEGQIPALEIPCPTHPSTFDAQFASLDRYEREAARSAAQNSLQLAADLSTSYLLVRLGRVDISPRLEVAMVEAWRESEGQSTDFDDLRRELIETRARNAPRHLEAAFYDLEYLAAEAQQHDLILGILPPARYTGFPLPEELHQLLTEFGAPVTYWHDAGQARLFETLGLLPQDAWLAAAGELVSGVHLHDTRGLRKYLPPQTEGSVPFAALASRLPPDVHCTCLFSADHEPAAVSAGLQQLQSLLNRPEAQGEIVEG